MKWISEHRGAAIFCLILFLLAVLAIAARFYLSRRSDRGGPSVKRGKNRGEGSPETPAAPSKQQTANDFMYEKTLLEQRMAKCAGVLRIVGERHK